MPETTLPIFVTDTHALLWLLNAPERLGPQAAAAFEAVDQGKALLIVPAIVVAELIYIADRGRVSVDLEMTLDYLRKHPAIDLPDMTLVVVLAMRSATAIPEMHDRLIACEAKLRNATLRTRDAQIVAARFVPTVW